ncbi:hypothetical protein VTN00DRAFT_10402 [Thermoascus crustaceus]|uniref:uncharacterized protein n=1 Tax=Thermoascus crustaceus TaxID=5088 RepID=UPI00374355FB
MRLLLTLSVLLFNLISFTAASSSTTASTSTADIFYWPVSSEKPSLLARVSYDPTTLESSVLSYTPPEATQDGPDDLVRIGFFTSTPEKTQQWVGGLSSRSSLSPEASAREHEKSIPALRLHLGPADELYHVALSSASSSSAKSTSDESQLGVEIVRPDVGPRPQLNRPIVVSPDGGPEEIPEKTFFQKYWWVILIVTFLAMSGGAEPQQ